MHHAAEDELAPAEPYQSPQFRRFHDRHPWAYESIVDRARALKAAGYKNVGIRYLYEHLRYSDPNCRAEARAGLDYGLFLLRDNVMVIAQGKCHPACCVCACAVVVFSVAHLVEPEVAEPLQLESVRPSGS